VTRQGGATISDKPYLPSCVIAVFPILADPVDVKSGDQLCDSRHVRAIPWHSGRWRARRRIDTGHAGRLYGRERARGHVQPRCRGEGGVGRGKGCRLCHRSGGGPPASRGAHGRGRHSVAQRTYARRGGRPTRRTGGRVGLIAARRGACDRAARWLDGVSNRRMSLRAGTARNSGRYPKCANSGSISTLLAPMTQGHGERYT